MKQMTSTSHITFSFNAQNTLAIQPLTNNFLSSIIIHFYFCFLDFFKGSLGSKPLELNPHLLIVNLLSKETILTVMVIHVFKKTHTKEQIN